MRDRFNIYALILVVLALFALTGANVNAQDDTAGRVLRQINRARADAGLPELARNRFLDASAQGHAEDLLKNGSQLGHRGSNGSNFQARIQWAGYQPAAMGENWAAMRNLDLIMEFWLNDPPHRRNILGSKFAEVGIGVAVRGNGGLIIVTDFGTQLSPEKIQVAQAAAEAKKKAKPTAELTKAEPTKAKPKPTAVPPTRTPKAKPTAVPLPAPTQPPPTIVQVAIAQAPPPQPVIAPLRARGKRAHITLQGNAFVSINAVPKNSKGWQQFFGGALALGGVFLMGVAIIGQRRRSSKW